MTPPPFRSTSDRRPLVVVGDVLLDVDVVGTAARMSPEAPVPVISSPSEIFRPGGAALAASLAARGTRPVVLVAPLARDEAAERVRTMLDDRVRLVALPWAGSTPVKTRVRAGNHPVTRIDTGGAAGLIGPIPEEAAAAFAEAAAVLVSDYGHGTTSDERIRSLITGALGRRPGGLGSASSRGAGRAGNIAGHAQRAGAVRIRRRSVRRFADRHSQGGGGLRRSVAGGGGLRDHRCARGLAVHRTRRTAAGHRDPGDGHRQLRRRGQLSPRPWQPPWPTERCRPKRSLRRWRRRAGSSLPAEQPPSMPPRCRLADQDLASRLDSVRAAGGVVVATGGCFDLLHSGHVATLEAARALGDFLVVCLNSDDSVRRLKGPQRPLQRVEDRSRVLSALRPVDAVVVFDEDTPIEALRRIRPQVWVKGGDYSGIPLPEASILSEWGGEVITVPYVAGKSTSELVSLAVEIDDRGDPPGGARPARARAGRLPDRPAGAVAAQAGTAGSFGGARGTGRVRAAGPVRRGDRPPAAHR